MEPLKIRGTRSLRESALDTFDKRMAQLPKEVKFCKKCVVSNQRPNIHFDEEGICSACRFQERKKEAINWEKRKKEFETFLERFRSKDGRFDVIVPCSGGKDSGAIAHRLKHEYGMHPLCVTWAPMLYTEIGRQNLENMIQSGFDHLLITPNPILHRKLSRFSLVKMCAHFYAFGRGQIAAPFHIAKEKGIKLVMFAENGEAEYGGLREFENMQSVPREDFEKFYHAGMDLDMVLKAGVDEGYFTKEEVKSETFRLYTAPCYEDFIKHDLTMSWFFYYHKNIPQENYYYCAKNTGFVANPGRSEGTYSKYASLDDKTDGFHYYGAFVKFGIGRTTSDAAHEIRDGHITREEGIALVKRYDGEFPAKYFKEFLTYIDMSEDEFNTVMDAYRMDHIWKKEDGIWKLRHQVS